MDRPRSPTTARRRNRRYCTTSGSSKRSCARSSATCSGVALAPLSMTRTGSPGRRCTMAKTTTDTPKTTGMARARRCCRETSINGAASRRSRRAADAGWLLLQRHVVEDREGHHVEAVALNLLAHPHDGDLVDQRIGIRLLEERALDLLVELHARSLRGHGRGLVELLVDLGIRQTRAVEAEEAFGVEVGGHDGRIGEPPV